METARHRSVLLVDDEPNILKSFSNELMNEKELKLAVSVTTSGEEAIAGISRGLYDLVVTDLFMPKVDGFMVLQAAKRTDEHIKVIILTGFEDVQNAIKALRLGADDYLLKPCDIDELIYRIANCLAKLDLQKKLNIYERILPICSYCRKIRVDPPGETGSGPWLDLESYFQKVKGVNCSHGCCPECFQKIMPKRLRPRTDQGSD